MNLQVSDPALAKIKLALSPLNADFTSSELQFKQHPNVAKFGPTGERVVALKDPARSFPVSQSLAVLKWRYTGKDETHVPLSSKQFYALESHTLSNISPVNCWPTPSNDGTCEVNIEYELENDSLVLHDVVISIPLPYVSHGQSIQHHTDNSCQDWVISDCFFSHWRLVAERVYTFIRLDHAIDFR